MPMDSHGYGLYGPSHGDQAPDFGSHSNMTQHAADFSQNESQLSFVTPSSKYLAASSTGRSMKDLEEQLTQLKKENFNLKLRIYFAEERKKILQGTEHTDELVEKIIKLEVEHQNLKTDLSEKEDLIVQTAKAMEALEKGHEHKMNELKKLHESQVKELLSKIEQLEVDVTYSRFKHETANCYSHDTTVKNLESQVSHLESRLAESQQTIVNLQTDLGQSRQEVSSLNSKINELEQELSSRNSRLGEIYAEAKKSDQEKKLYQDEVKSLKLELSKMERNLQTKTDEVVRAKQDVCDKVLCSKRTDDEIKTLRKQVTGQTSLVDQLTSNKVELSQRIHQCEVSLEQEQARVKEMGRLLNEERGRNERGRQENEELKRDNEILRETLSRSRSKCPPQDPAKHSSRSPSPSTPSQLFISIKPSETASSYNRLHEDYNQLNEKHNALYESFTETCKKLEKTDTEYKKALSVIRNMVKENKRSAHQLESYKERLRQLEEQEKLASDALGGAGDRNTHARGQPEGSNEVQEEFTEKDIDLLEKQVLIEDYLKQINELNLKLTKYECSRPTPAMEENEMTFMALQLKSKTEEIERLNTELKKRTFNLQELVNTELWQKNKEIEKLMRKSEKKQTELSHMKQILREKENHLLYLQKEMNDIHAEINANVSGGTLLPDHRKLIDRLKSLKENIDCVSVDKEGLLTQLANLKVSLNICDKQRREALQACWVLNKRLEELADFLESLISSSDVLSLSSKKKQIIKHAVDASRELSRTFSVTFNLLQSSEVDQNVPILPDYSEINFLSESDELADVTLEPDVEAETGDVNSKDQVIQKLRSQVHTLRYQVKQKDIEIASRTLVSGELSACEAFSEPDLVVSKARMGGVCDSNVVSWPSSDSESLLDEDSTRVSKYKGKRNLRFEKNNEQTKVLQEKIDELSKVNEQLRQEKEMLGSKMSPTSNRDQGTSVQDDHPNEGKREETSTALILHKLEHLESMYSLITNKDDLVKELELYNQAKSRVSNLESELMMIKCKNTEMKEKLNELREEIRNYEKANKELKENVIEEKNKNVETCKQQEELEATRQQLVENEVALKTELEASQLLCKKLELDLEQSKLECHKQDEQFETMKQSINMLKEEIQNLTMVVKSKTDEVSQRNIEVSELKNKNDDLQSQVLNLSSDLDKVKNDDEIRHKYDKTKSLLDETNERLETLTIDYEHAKKELSENSEKYKCDNMKLQDELESAMKAKQELSLQFELTRSELKNANDHTNELKSHYETLKVQLYKSNEIIDDLNLKLNQAKVDLENSNHKLEMMNSSLNETHENINELKLNLNDEIHTCKSYKDENEKLVSKIKAMENNKRTWEKEINSLRLTLKKYRENEETEILKHTELVHDMTRKMDEFKHERVQLNFEIRELRRKVEELGKEKEELIAKYEEQQEKVVKQNNRTLQEIQNEMKVKLDTANEKMVQKDDKLEQIEELYKLINHPVRILNCLVSNILCLTCCFHASYPLNLKTNTCNRKVLILALRAGVNF
uniref:Centrosomin n=1 Tax=Cacopsylla melanoneura TaxID=428564 RepID=A0A8D8UEV9_9HEMI